MKQAIAVAISGKGRSLANLLRVQDQYSYQIKAVISSSPACLGNNIAEEAGLPLFIGNFSSSNCHKDLPRWLGDLGINWIALAGFLKMFPMLPEFQNKVVNIHPALLPKYGGAGMYGMKVHQAVYAAGELNSGATVHFVSSEYDEGPAIARIQIPIEGLSPEEIASKVFEAECLLYPKVLDGLVQGTLPLKDEVWELKL